MRIAAIVFDSVLTRPSFRFNPITKVVSSLPTYQIFLGARNVVWLNINGEQIDESVFYTSCWGSCDLYSLGSRTLYVRLVEGDTITIRSSEIFRLSTINICFQLAQYDDFP